MNSVSSKAVMRNGLARSLGQSRLQDSRWFQATGSALTVSARLGPVARQSGLGIDEEQRASLDRQLGERYIRKSYWIHAVIVTDQAFESKASVFQVLWG